MSDDAITHDEIAELLGAFALDAVDGAERDLVEAHLTGCPRCRAEVESHREVASMLAFGGGPAPDGLWDRIAGSLEEAPPGIRLVSADPAATDARAVGPARPSRRYLWPAVAAAAAVAVIAALGIQVRQQDQRIDELQVALSDPLDPAYRAALEDPSSEIVDLTSADGGVSVRAAVTPDGVGLMRADTLPTLPDDRTYQLWGVAGVEVVSLGVMGPDPDIVTFVDAGYSAFAITEEVAAGVVTSQATPVVSGARST